MNPVDSYICTPHGREIGERGGLQAPTLPELDRREVTALRRDSHSTFVCDSFVVVGAVFVIAMGAHATYTFNKTAIFLAIR